MPIHKITSISCPYFVSQERFIFSAVSCFRFQSLLWRVERILHQIALATLHTHLTHRALAWIYIWLRGLRFVSRLGNIAVFSSRMTHTRRISSCTLMMDGWRDEWYARGGKIERVRDRSHLPSCSCWVRQRLLL